MDKKKSLLEAFADNKLTHTILSILIAFVVGAIFLSVMGISVADAYGTLFRSVFSGPKGLSYAIVYATPYIVVGLSVAFSFRTGVFNIGAEGQFVVGSMSACVVGILLGNLPSIVLIPLCFLAAAVAGAVWGVIVGFLKNKWGINEVLSMIMFNWIAFYLSNYIAGFPAIHNEGNAEATRNVSENARILFSKDFINELGLCSTANWGIFVAIVLTVIVYLIIEKTTLGYQLKAVGFNKSAAEYGGINVNRSILAALAISGALAGIGGALQLLGMGGRISIFTAQEGFGFAGIVVALIGVSSPFGVFLAGLFYGALTFGGAKLNLVGAPTQVVDIIVGTVVFFIAISAIFGYIKNLKKKPSDSKAQKEETK
ncbi:MAG: ABC transporter permease [Oscillospiraceae bacterium]|nr:ABC transporter permease [Oscillospiraceae bacterium]